MTLPNSHTISCMNIVTLGDGAGICKVTLSIISKHSSSGLINLFSTVNSTGPMNLARQSFQLSNHSAHKLGHSSFLCLFSTSAKYVFTLEPQLKSSISFKKQVKVVFLTQTLVGGSPTHICHVFSVRSCPSAMAGPRTAYVSDDWQPTFLPIKTQSNGAACETQRSYQTGVSNSVGLLGSGTGNMEKPFVTIRKWRRGS